MQLNVAVYKLTESFAREELYGLSSQLRRAAISVISNIAEGHGRGSQAQLVQFLFIARGSAFEVEAQLLLAKELRFADVETIGRCESLCGEVSRMLHSMVRKLRASTDSA